MKVTPFAKVWLGALFHEAAAILSPTWRQGVCSSVRRRSKKIEISRMDRCRTHRCPAPSALRFSWAESLLAEEVA